MNKVVAVIVTYNRKELLKNCIEALMDSSYPCDILVVDNNSTDGTRDYIRDFLDKELIIYHNTGANLGGAGGFHVGMELAVQKNYSYIWLMDDDTIVSMDALEKLMEADQKLKGNYGFLSSIAYWKDGSICNMNVQRVGLHRKIEEYKEITPVIMATFVSFFVKSETVMNAGLPIKEFFVWADDLEYSRRISRNMTCYAVPESIVEHHMESNEKVNVAKDSPDRMWRYDYLYRNEVYVYRREGIRGLIYLIIRMFKHSLLILKDANNGKSLKLKRIWKSFFSGVRFNPEIEYLKEIGK